MNSKLREIIITFTPSEVLDFEHHLHTPSFSVSKQVIQLFQLIKKEFRLPNPRKNRTNSPSDLREQWFKMLYPDKQEFNKTANQRMANLETDLLKLVQQFVCRVEFEKTTFAKHHTLLKAYEKRGLKRLKNLELEKGIHSSKNDLDSLQFNKLLHAQMYYQSVNISLNRNKDKAGKALEKLVRQIDQFYLYYRYRYLRVMQRREEFTNYQFDYSIIPFLEELREKHKDLQIVQFYALDYNLGNTKSKADFDKTYKFYEAIKDHISPYDNAQLLQGLANFCSIAALGNDPKFWRSKRLQCYEAFFEGGLCYIGKDLIKKTIALPHYENYLLLSFESSDPSKPRKIESQFYKSINFNSPTRKNQYAQVFKFYKHYLGKNELSTKFDPSDSIGKIYQNYERKNNEYLLLTFEIIELKYYYSQGQFEAIEFPCKSIIRRIQRSKRIGELFKTAHINFLKGLHHLTIISESSQSKYRSKEAISDSKTKLNEILQQTYVFNRDWLFVNGKTG